LKEQQIKRISFTREVDGRRIEVPAEIIPSVLFGLPITADQDKYLALQEIISNTLVSEGEVKNPIRFKSAELLRLMASRYKCGKELQRNRGVARRHDINDDTVNGTVYVAGQKKYVTDRFQVLIALSVWART